MLVDTYEIRCRMMVNLDALTATYKSKFTWTCGRDINPIGLEGYYMRISTKVYDITNTYARRMLPSRPSSSFLFFLSLLSFGWHVIPRAASPYKSHNAYVHEQLRCVSQSRHGFCTQVRLRISLLVITYAYGLLGY